MYMFSGEISKLLNYLKKYYSYQLKRVELKKKKKKSDYKRKKIYGLAISL